MKARLSSLVSTDSKREGNASRRAQLANDQFSGRVSSEYQEDSLPGNEVWRACHMLPGGLEPRAAAGRGRESRSAQISVNLGGEAHSALSSWPVHHRTHRLSLHVSRVCQAQPRIAGKPRRNTMDSRPQASRASSLREMNARRARKWPRRRMRDA